jgi:hypothetical protein
MPAIGVYAFLIYFLPATTRHNATNTLLSCTIVLLFLVLYFQKDTALKLGYTFVFPKTSYCRNLCVFHFYSD